MLVGFFVFFSPVQAAGGAWQVIGADHFSSSTVTTVPIVINSNGVPYVAYEDTANGNKATVMKFDGSAWATVGNAGFSPDQAGGLSLALDATGTPYVAFANAASSSRATVMKFDGSNWVIVGTANFSTSTITGTKIVFSPSNTPYIAFADGGNHITVMKYNGSSWVAVGSPYIAALGAVPVLVFSSTGTPYVAFSDIGTGQPTIIKFDGSSWNLVGNPIASVNLATNVSFAISSSDVLYVGTTDIADYYLRTFTFDGSDWVRIGTTGTDVTSGDTVMAFSPSGTLYLALEHTNNKAIVMKYNGSDWEVVGDPQFSTTAITMMSLAFNASGTPYVAYGDYSSNQVVVMAFLPTTPGQVTGLSVSSQPLSALALLWTAPLDNGGSAITGYRIERESPIGGGFSVITTVSASPTSYMDTGLTPSTRYNYRISVINSIGTGTTSVEKDNTTVGVGGGGTVGVGAAYIPPAAPVFNPGNTELLFTSNASAQTPTLLTNYQPTVPISTPVVSDPVFTPPVYVFKRTLKVGSRGADVKALQVFLNTHGFLLASSGVGSPGHETSLYGKLTANTVAKFQEAYARKILVPLGLTKGTGIFGSATMKVVNQQN
jgi:hypothetical protein